MLAGGVETCKANNIEPCGYLLALFKAPPLAQRAVDYEALLPWRLATPTI
jgi:transposase